MDTEKKAQGFTITFMFFCVIVLVSLFVFGSSEVIKDKRQHSAYREYTRTKAKLTPLQIELVNEAEDVDDYIKAKKRYEQYK